MTKVTLWKCDRCGSNYRYKNNQVLIKLVLFPISLLKIIFYIWGSDPFDYSYPSTWDFCEDCSSDFIKWLSKGRK